MNIRNTLIGLGRGLLLSIAFLPAVWSGAVAAANLSGRSMADFAMQPILSLQSVPPLVMLTMSMDHQYWQKAYNDYTDLNNDGVVERTYSDTFEYYGYFHAQRCYAYSDSDKRFVMEAGSDGVAKGTNKHYCDGAWSGNFLNWATMTRMDVVRKVLFGGQRVVDTASQTVLERAHLPSDAHSFVKYYNGSDIDKLTPHSSLKTDTTNGGNNNGLDNADEGISICNTTYASSGSSQATTAPPVIRVAKGNFSLWSANERWQCTWQDERGTNTSSNVSAESDIYASANDPSSASELKSPGGSRDQVVRVEVCATAPARLFGLATKGALAEGYDADVVIYDPNATSVLSAKNHHMNLDYSAYEGVSVQGGVRTVLSRGEVIVDKGTFLGRVGRGKYLRREISRHIH
jgi:type IV pilus assembly protein PilY1